MFIFQPERYLLRQQIQKLSYYVRGIVLDIGAGRFDRYSDLFSADHYVRLELESGPGIQLVGSAEAIPCEDATVDSVVCTQVLEHISHPERAIREIARVLRPGGACLMTVPQLAELHEEPHDFFRFTKYGLRQLFTDVGMELIHEEQRGGYFVSLVHMGVRYLTDRWHLYNHRLLGRVASRAFHVAFTIANWLDGHDRSNAGRRTTIGWAVVYKKPSTP